MQPKITFDKFPTEGQNQIWQVNWHFWLFYKIPSIFSDKPPIEELHYFLDFQIQRVWAPAANSIPGPQRREPVCPVLQLSLISKSKLYVSPEQVNI
jgi:hypothetical protein